MAPLIQINFNFPKPLDFAHALLPLKPTSRVLNDPSLRELVGINQIAQAYVTVKLLAVLTLRRDKSLGSFC